MNEYQFHVQATVTVSAESEEEARQKLINGCILQDDDVWYGGSLDLQGYIGTPYEKDQAILKSVETEDGEITEY